MNNLQGKKVLITGGSRGIGRAIAEAFLKEGALVWIGARNPDELEATVYNFSSHGTIKGTLLDVSDKNNVGKIIEEIKAEWGSIDVLINAAGVYGPIGIVSEVDPEEWLGALKINLYGTFLVTHYAVPLMPSGSTIINFVGGGEGAYAHFSSYVAAKGGIARLTETTATELKEKGIAVNAIAPGAVNTKFLDDLIAAGPEKAGAENYEKALKQKQSGGVSPEKAAELALWLASEKAQGLTGKILSALWDKYEDFPSHMEEIQKSDVYTFRRIRPKDRGFDWPEN